MYLVSVEWSDGAISGKRYTELEDLIDAKEFAETEAKKLKSNNAILEYDVRIWELTNY